MHVTEMQQAQPDRAQASPAASKPSSADLLRVIPAMISQQSLELAELKEALREIFHKLPRTETFPQYYISLLFTESRFRSRQYSTLLFWLGAKALQWAAAVGRSRKRWAEASTAFYTNSSWCSIIRRREDKVVRSFWPPAGKEISHKLRAQVRIIAATSDWVPSYMCVVFSRGLNTNLQKALAGQDYALSCNKLISLAISLDHLEQVVCPPLSFVGVMRRASACIVGEKTTS